MTTYVALLYSIILGEGRRLVMADLKEMAGELGLKNPRTLVATGNLLFETRKTALPVLEAKLEKAFAARFGKHIDIILRDADTWRSVVAANPYPQEAAADPEKVGLRIMRQPIDAAGFDTLRRYLGPNEDACMIDGNLWAHFGDGTQKTRFLSAVTPKRAGIGTWRNWNTVRRLGEMVDV